MNIVELTCIKCPKGCHLKVMLGENGVESVGGNSCPKGAEYAEKETTNPTRMVTSTVRISGAELPVLPVRLDEEIPKEAIFSVMEAIRGYTAKAPVEIGDVLIENVCGLGVNVAAAASADALKHSSKHSLKY